MKIILTFVGVAACASEALAQRGQVLTDGSSSGSSPSEASQGPTSIAAGLPTASEEGSTALAPNMSFWDMERMGEEIAEGDIWKAEHDAQKPTTGGQSQPVRPEVPPNLEEEQPVQSNSDLDGVLKFFDEIENKGEKIILKEEDELEEFEEEFTDDLPVYKKNWHDSVHTAWDFIVYFRWIINMVTVAIPFTILCLILIGFDVVVNIVFNKWWAKGNALLVGQSIYLVVQTFLSVWLIWEIPAWLRKFKIIRCFSWLLALIYTVVWVIALLKLLLMVFVDDNSSDDYETLMLALFLAYAVIMAAPAIPVNIAIVVKELVLEEFTLLNKHIGQKKDERYDYALGKTDAETSMWDFLWLISPFTWIDMVWNFIFNDVLKGAFSK